MAKSKRSRRPKTYKPRFLFNLDLLLKLVADKGWSDTDFAEASGVTQGAISRILRGNTRQPDNDTLVKLASPFGLKASDFILPINGTTPSAQQLQETA